MQGKKGLVVGIANDRSYATYITESLLKAGAQCAFTHLPGEKMERRTRKIAETLGVATSCASAFARPPRHAAALPSNISRRHAA